MFLLILLASIATVAAKNETKCINCIKVNSKCHNVSYLQDLVAPFRNTVVITKLGILRSKNLLYFAFEPEISDPEYYKIGFVNLDDYNISGIVNGSKPVYNFGTFDVDQENNIVYAGGSDGLYFLDATNKATFFSSGGDTIKSLLYKGNVYFVRDGENKIIEKRDDQFKIYEEYGSVKTFVLNNNNILVFLNNTGLYASKFKTADSVYLSKNAYFRGLTIDLDGVIYTWWVDGIYKVNIGVDFSDSNVVKVADVTGIGALTFDNDNNFILNIGKGLFRLIETNSTLC